MKILNYPSPNFNDRAANKQLCFIVLHYTDMQCARAALERLADPESKVSAHYLISKTGEIFQIVNDAKRAWHAGQGYWQGETDLNSTSLGIELDNGGHTFGPEPYPEAQLSALLFLLEKLCTTHGIARTNIIGHSDLAPTRKQDPGEHFPWQWLQHQGYGIEISAEPQRPPASTLLEIQQQLRMIGYDCPLTNALDPVTTAVITAFQRHFTPQEISGNIPPLFIKALTHIKLN